MLSYSHAALLGLLQGVTELFPVSSLGHTILLPSLLGWQLNQASQEFVAFIVLTHAATALVLLGFFWRDWFVILGALWRALQTRDFSLKDANARVGFLLVLSTVPAGALGLLFEKKFTELFASPRIVATALILNGLVLYSAEKLASRSAKRSAEQEIKQKTEKNTILAGLSIKQAVTIGFLQCLALVPGFSRTGSAMTGGLLAGLSREHAARYSFLLATPIIFAAAVHKVPKLFGESHAVLYPSLFGALCAGAAAYLSVRFLSAYFEDKTLTPFALYCVLAGAGSLLFFL